MSLIRKEKGGGRRRGLTVRKRQQKPLADNSMGWEWGREILGKGTSPLQMRVIASTSLPQGVLEDSPQPPTTEGGAPFQNVARCSFISVPPRTCPLQCPPSCKAICLQEAEPRSAISASSQVHPVSHKRLLPSFFEKCTGPEGSSLRGVHMEPILSGFYPWPKAGMMNGSCQRCIVSVAACELCLPGPIQPAMRWDCSTPACN